MRDILPRCGSHATARITNPRCTATPAQELNVPFSVNLAIQSQIVSPTQLLEPNAIRGWITERAGPSWSLLLLLLAGSTAEP